MKCKHLWRGAFNYQRSAEILYRYAYTERQAWYRMCSDLAKKHGVCTQAVTGLFDGSKDNYQISIETEYKQLEEMEGRDENYEKAL